MFDSPKSEPVIEEKSKDKKKNVNSIRPEFTHDSSNSPISSPAVSPKEPVSQKIEFKKELLPEPKETKPPPEKSKPKKEKSKKNKDKKSDKEEKKRKRKSEGVTEDEPPEKLSRKIPIQMFLILNKTTPMCPLRRISTRKIKKIPKITCKFYVICNTKLRLYRIIRSFRKLYS